MGTERILVGLWWTFFTLGSSLRRVDNVARSQEMQGNARAINSQIWIPNLRLNPELGVLQKSREKEPSERCGLGSLFGPKCPKIYVFIPLMHNN